jgi:hypothetical protein
MKPKEQKSQALKQAKGLARWGWIKRYLKPAMDYVGITSEQFDEVFIGNDQFIKERTRASPFSSPVISIMGDIYTPTGSVPPQSNNNDGFLYIEFIAAIGNTEFEPDGDPSIVYGWDGTIEFHPTNGLPRYRFYGTEQTDGTFLYVNQSILGLGEWATIKILIASRQEGVIQLYGLRDGTAVNVALKGLQEVSVIQGLPS